jgi:hypothetical protein
LVGGLLALAAGVVACGAGSSHHTASPTDAVFHTSGHEIVAPNGQQFAPDGFVLECLAQTNLSCGQASSTNPETDPAKIEAAATFWHANAIRLQVAQEHLFDQSPYDSSYLSAVDSEVQLANRLGMAAIVTLQEEEYSGPPLPTATAVRFWKFMAQHFRTDPDVIFDLYNEPRLPPYDGESWLWNIWRNGGPVDTHGTDDTFVGMQTLVDDVRQTGAQNLIIAESNGSDHDLSQVMTHLLSGTNIAYAYEPNLKRRQQNPQQWNAAFGDVAQHEPVVMDAFRDYPTSGACFANSPTVLPQLLSYLTSLHLGLISWTMQAGNMIVGNNLDRPTSYQGQSTQLCVPATKKSHQALDQGAGASYNANTSSNGPGADILAFFQANSRQLLASP